MMIYVMSDIHGQYEAYLQMLDIIQLAPSDMLYIIGDVTDRGPHGIPLLLDIMNRDNIILLRGNHEQILLEHYGDCPSALPVNYEYWLHVLGGESTDKAYNKLRPEQQQAVLQYINRTPLQLHIEVEGLVYYLVHGYPDPSDYPECLLWGRFDQQGALSYTNHEIVIFGHTPTTDYQSGSPMRIYYGGNVIGIDCGCAYGQFPGRLGCLCLNDWREYYVDI